MVAPGTDITDAGVEPAFAGVEFTQSTGFVALTPGEYDVIVTLAGDTTPAISLLSAAFAGGDVITAIASDPVGEEPAPGLVIVDHVDLKTPSVN